MRLVAAGSADALPIERTPGQDVPRKAVFERLDRFVGRLPADWKSNREEATAR
ncbi:hypothetical protein [Sandarakinorhabdus sp. DWP1-3-1]|uniref:hypothetical protein n=1 Tax=Sandarakinorhabdus sp. DWP1-3-1 TaxID=2804627 RepID=UPI003CF0CB3A